GARERHLGKTAGRRNLVAAEVDTLAAIDPGAVAPGRPGEVEGAAASLHDLASAPCGALPPVLEGQVEQRFQARGSSVGTLMRTDRHLSLHQLLAGRRERAVLGTEALDPSGSLEIGDDPRVAAALAHGKIQADGVSARPPQ